MSTDAVKPQSSAASNARMSLKRKFEELSEEDRNASAEVLFAKQYSIVKNLLQKLPLADLLAAAQVCKIWSEVARVVRKQRHNKPYVMLYHPYLPHTELAVEFFNGHKISPAAKNLIATGPENGFPNVDDLVDEHRYEELVPMMNSTMKKTFCSSFNEAQLALFFGTEALYQYVSERKTRKVSRADLLFGTIKNAVPCVGTFSYGLVATSPEDSVSLEIENAEFPIVNCLAIPKIPGFKVKTFALSKEINAEFKGKVDEENCKEILNIGANDNVKGIVIFHTDTRRCSALVDAIHFYLKQNPNVALAGGSNAKTLHSTAEEEPLLATGIIICGDENVKVASVGLLDKKISKANEDNLLKLKNCGLEEEGSFAFMFACNGRGVSMHESTHVEATLFRKHFPNTLLIGTFTDGEYLHEYIPTPGNTVEPPSKPTSIDRTFATVFVFVSCKQPARQPIVNANNS